MPRSGALICRDPSAEARLATTQVARKVAFEGALPGGAGAPGGGTPVWPAQYGQPEICRYRLCVRCYLIAEGPTDLSAVRAALSERGVEPVEPARAFDGPVLGGRGWLPDVDFLCAIFPADHGWETPPAVYLEIGQAVGAGMPVLLIVEPSRRLDPSLSPLPAIRVPVVGTVLASHIGLFLQSIGRPSTGVEPSRPADSAELSAVHDELRALRDTVTLGGSGEARRTTGRRIEELALRLFRAAGAEAADATGADGNGDIAAWVPGTEQFIPGPLLVELKIVRDSILNRAILDQLQHYALTRGAQWSVLLYYRWDLRRKVRLPSGGTWPTVMVFDIEELARDLRHRTLAQILNNERNAIVHGVGKR